MGNPDELSELTAQIRKLVETLDAPKKRDLWDRLPTLTSFLGTVVIAGVGLFFTRAYHHAQIENQRAQSRIEELKAITALVPQLSSQDSATRETARQVLRAVQASGASRQRNSGTRRSPGGQTGRVVGGARQASLTPLLDAAAQIALSPNAPVAERVEATREIGRIADAPEASPALRERAADVATQIAISPGAPPEVRRTAEQVIAGLKQVAPAEVAGIVRAEPKTRAIDEVILHSSDSPAAAYRGPQTIFGLARFQVEERGWSNVSWHYAVAPDGSIWLGVPLAQAAAHVRGRNQTSVSVMLVLDGDRELPTAAQRAALATLLRELFAHLDLKAEDNFSRNRGFHRDHSGTNCPGGRLTKQLVLDWIRSA